MIGLTKNFELKRLLDTLQNDENDIRKRIADNSRQMYVLRSSEKKLQLKCEALEETDLNIIKVKIFILEQKQF